MGIETWRSAAWRQAVGQAGVLGADDERARGPQVGVGVARRERRRRSRRAPTSRPAISSSVASTTGSVKTAPVEARIAFGFQGSAWRLGDDERVGARRLGRARHRAEVAGLLDPDRDEVERAVRAAARGAAPRRPRSRPRARRGRPSWRARARSPPRPPSHSSSSGAKYVATIRRPGGARPLDLARPLGDEEPAPPPLAALAQADDLLDARVVDRGDHSALAARDARAARPRPRFAARARMNSRSESRFR